MKDIQRQAQEDIEKKGAGASVKPPEEEIAEEAVREASTETPEVKEPIPEPEPEQKEVQEEAKSEELKPLNLKIPRIDLSGAKKILLKK